MNRYLQPPEIIEDIDGPVIFTAGPIQGAPDWQSEAVETIHTLDWSITVASPRKNYASSEFIYEKQVDWETYYLNRAARFGVIMFWLAIQAEETPGRAYAQTSRFELGEWKSKHEADNRINLVVGIEEGFGNERYIRRRFEQDCPEIPILGNLVETCLVAVQLARAT